MKHTARAIVLALILILILAACSGANGNQLTLPKINIPSIDRQARSFGQFNGVSVSVDGDFNVDKISNTTPPPPGNIVPLFKIELRDDLLILHFLDGRAVADIGNTRLAFNFNDLSLIFKFLGLQAAQSLPSGEKTIYVGPNLVPCVGTAPQTCMQVRENPAAPWNLYYGSIQGFDYEEGYIYELRVSEEVNPNAPADASSLQLTLVEVVSKDAVSTSLTGTLWQLETLKGKSAIQNAEVNAIFGEDGSLSGSGGCNSYRTTYQVGGSTITIEPASTTRMACPEQAVMDQESAYLKALEDAKTFEIVGYRLSLTDADGNSLMTFMAGE